MLPLSTPATFLELQQSIEEFAKQHSVTPDILFALLFESLYHRIESIGMANKMFLEQPINARPSACALTQGSKPDSCRLTFLEGWFPDHDPLHNFYLDHHRSASFASMLAVFIAENESGPLDRNVDSAELRYRTALESSTTTPTQPLLFTLPLRASFDTTLQESLPHWKKFFTSRFPYAEFPITYLMQFLKSPQCIASVQRIKAQPLHAAAYDHETPDPLFSIAGFKSETINDYGAYRILTFEHTLRLLQQVFHPHALAIGKSDFVLPSYYSPVFVKALYKMFLDTDITEPCAISNAIDRRYENHKRHFFIYVNTDVKTTNALLARINEIMPNAAFEYECKDLYNASPHLTPHVFKLSYSFVITCLITSGRLQKFLDANPEFIKAMQDQYAKLVRPSDPYYEFYSQRQTSALTPAPT